MHEQRTKKCFLEVKFKKGEGNIQTTVRRKGDNRNTGAEKINSRKGAEKINYYGHGALL